MHGTTYRYQVRLAVNGLLDTDNAAPEWQARTLERMQGIGGGLSTRGVCYPFLYAMTLLWSAS